MRKKIMVVLGIMLVIAILGVSYMNTSKTKKEEKVEEIVVSEEKEEMVSLQTARENLNSLMEEGKKGAYRNLVFEEFTPAITSEDAIYTLQIETPTRYHDMENESLVETQVEVLKQFFGEDMDMNALVEWNTQQSYQELMEEFENGTYSSEQIPYMVYDKDELHGQVSGGISSLWMDLGIEGAMPDDENALDKKYYAFGAEKDLATCYKTSNKKMSVKEAIAEVENYFNENLPIPLESDERYCVSEVEVIKQEDGTYAFEMFVRNSYHGVLFEFELLGADYGVNQEADRMVVLLEGEGEIPFFNGMSLNNKITVIDTKKEILDPIAAVDYVSKKIGDSTVYDLYGMELAYQSIRGEDGICTATPVWMLLLRRQTDDKETRFYVNASTGELSSRVVK